MNNWADAIARQNAVRAFVEYLFKPGNEADRKKATDPKGRLFAKELFARLGESEIGGAQPDATKIPAKMEFRVYEEKETKPRDEDLGIMFLPETLQTPVDVSQVWICTWEDWTSFTSQTPQTESS